MAAAVWFALLLLVALPTWISAEPTAVEKSPKAPSPSAPVKAPFTLESTPKPTAAQVSAFKSCLANFQSKSSALKAVFQQDSGSYRNMLSLNAQSRGQNLMPLAFVQPSNTAGAAAAVRCAGGAGLKFTARNGGHSYEANSLLAGGVVIDLLTMQDIDVDAAAGVLTLGAGQRLGTIYSVLNSYGYVLPAGTCAGVGISGHTLGGGIGHGTRKLGVLADSVLGATVVLANGTVVQANDKSHPDLFWAIRGGGPFYGIVTSWKFKLHKAPAQVSVVRYRFKEGCTEAKYAEVLAAFNAWKPWELSKDHAMAEIQCGYGNLQVQFWYWGPMSEANKTVAASPVFKITGIYPFVHKAYGWSDFIALRATNLQDEKEWGWRNLALNNILERGSKDRGSFTAASLLPMAPMDATAVAIMAKWMAQAQKHAFIQSRTWGGQVSAVKSDFNAFPWRKALYECQVYSSSGDAAVDRQWVDGLLAAMQPLVGKAEYYNYFHCVKDPWQSYFGPHAARLQAIKKAYDPQAKLGGLYCQQDTIMY